MVGEGRQTSTKTFAGFPHIPEHRIIFNLLFLDRLLPVFQKGIKALARRFIPMVPGIRSLVYITVNCNAALRMIHQRIFRAVLHGCYLLGSILRKRLEPASLSNFGMEFASGLMVCAPA
jgi:hypothetical protein